jgi:myo-inositol 2-dehydrogenase/D-chiro-inositol 1-dehydrogenase
MKRRTFLKNSAAAAAASLVVPTIIPSRVLGKNAPSNLIRVGQIGFGRIARSHDLPETLQHEMALGVAVADVDIKRARMGKDWIEKFHADQGKSAVDVAVYQDYREMLEDQSIDAVIISTPDHWHAQPAMEAALAGKDIYLQKPASLTIPEGRQMSDMVHRTGVIFQQGSQQRGTSPWPQFHRAANWCATAASGSCKNWKSAFPAIPGARKNRPCLCPKTWTTICGWDRPPTGITPKNGYTRR